MSTLFMSGNDVNKKAFLVSDNLKYFFLCPGDAVL